MAQPLKLSIILDFVDKTAGLGEVDKRITRLGQSARQASLGVGLAGAAIVGAMGKGVAELSRFEEAMATVETLVDTSVVSMDELADGVRRIARETGEGPAELADALYQTISAGVGAGEALEFLEVASHGAIAGLTNTFVAVDTLTTLLNAYGQESEEAINVSDRLTTAQNLGKTTWDKMGAAMAYVAGTAATAGIEMKELLAALSAITTQGFQTDMAARSLNQALLFMIKNGMAATIAEKGLVQALKDLEEESGGTVDGMMEIVGSSEAARAIFALTGDGAKAFADTLEAMGTAAGTTEEAFATMSDTTVRRMKKLEVAMTEVWIDIGEAVLPILEALVPAVMGLLKGFQRLIDLPFGNWIVVGTAALGGFMLAVAPLMYALPSLIKMYTGLRGAVIAYTVAQRAANVATAGGVATGAARGAQMALPGLAAGAAGRAGLLARGAAAIGGLGAGAGAVGGLATAGLGLAAGGAGYAAGYYPGQWLSKIGQRREQKAFETRMQAVREQGPRYRGQMGPGGQIIVVEHRIRKDGTEELSPGQERAVETIVNEVARQTAVAPG